MQCIQFQNRSSGNTTVPVSPVQSADSLFKQAVLPCARTSLLRGRNGSLLIQRLTASGFIICMYHLVAVADVLLETSLSEQGFYLTYILKAPSPIRCLQDIELNENEYHLFCLQPGKYEWSFTEGTFVIMHVYISMMTMQALSNDFPVLVSGISSMLRNSETIMSPKPNRISYTARQCISQITNCRFTGSAAATYLNLKARELVFDFAETFRAATLLNDSDREDLELLASIESYVNEHLHKPITSQSIMQIFSISEYRLKKIFKFKQVSPAEFIAQARMEKALSLLKFTNDKITAIGREVGYQNTSWFADAFFKYHGVKPSEVRSNALKPGTHSPDPDMENPKC